jgi:hypothetical protein
MTRNQYIDTSGIVCVYVCVYVCVCVRERARERDKSKNKSREFTRRLFDIEFCLTLFDRSLMIMATFLS